MTLRRFDSLQGLRGLAALTVVISHFLELFYLTGYDEGTPLELIRPISHTFGILSHKAVWIFFVLSGFVITHQLCLQTYTYRRYLLARLIRLYLPVWAAMSLNLVVVYILISQSKEIGFWIGAHPDLLSPGLILIELLLVPDGYFLGPLWSIKWEVAFSFLAFIAWRSNLMIRFPMVIATIFITVATFGGVLGSNFLKYLPMFLIGTIIYNSTVRLGHMAPINKRTEISTIFLAILLPIASYIMFSDSFGVSKSTYVADIPTSLVSIWLIFFALLRGSILKWLFEIKLLQKLGLISFSLYLFHLPVLMLVYYISDFDFIWTLFAFILCFPVARLGFSLIEFPAQRLSRKIKNGTNRF